KSLLETAPETALQERAAMRFGRYELLAQLDGGPDGVVYRAQDPSAASQDPSGRSPAGRVLQLVLLSGAQADPKRWAHLRKRLRLATMLRHPAAVAVHEAGLENDPPYVAMEWVEGKSLAQCR